MPSGARQAAPPSHETARAKLLLESSHFVLYVLVPVFRDFACCKEPRDHSFGIASSGTRAMKHTHEFRDPIHVFVTLDSDERRVVDSRPFQRLRYIHQLAASYLVFSGATHRRFEHSLGVMHLAGEVFDVVMAPQNVHHLIRREMPGDHQLGYWRRVVRLAALCHDIGHLLTCSPICPRL
jgi:hypothetical protein